MDKLTGYIVDYDALPKKFPTHMHDLLVKSSQNQAGVSNRLKTLSISSNLACLQEFHRVGYVAI